MSFELSGKEEGKVVIMGILKFFDKVLRKITTFNLFMEILVEICACLLAVVVIWGVILTYVFEKSDIFSVEVSEYILVFITFASIAYVLKEDRHVRVEVFLEHLSPKPRLILNIIASFFALVFCCVVMWKSTVVMLFNYEKGFHSASLVSFPMWIPYFVITIGSLLLTLQYIVHIRELFSRFKIIPKQTNDEI